MLPAQRREVLQQRIIHGLCMTPQRIDGPLQIHGVPQHNGRRDEVQAAGAVALLLEAAVPDFSEPVGVVSEFVHEHPLFAKVSIHDSKLKVKIAPVHSDFWCGDATVPDGICWLAPQSE